MNGKRIFSLAMGILVCSAADSYAQKYTWRCKFSTFEEQLSYVYDSDTRKGFLIGNIGTADLEVNLGNDAITFMEFLITGAVQTTTIILKTGDAIHSRHSVLENEFIPTQVSGKCKRLI